MDPVPPAPEPRVTAAVPVPTAPVPPAGRVYSASRHLRAALALLVVAILTLGAAYPLALVGFGELVDPSAAGGSLSYFSNGTVNGSHLLPSNTTSTVGLPPAGPVPAAVPSSWTHGGSPSAVRAPGRGPSLRSPPRPAPTDPAGWEVG